ncbi:metallophosphoesterase family protein [Celeribacter baekdonensis]|uniref:metallophosphoesterase family protein n=1 Tax=Celeribacter baekdonensis TaxID=875171 RepID=UPI003A903070|tara:strand:- start:257 stop:1030 length:774 start_codon:yes stop_codon:yes gene_type:complete
MFKRLFPRRRPVDVMPISRFEGLPPTPEEALAIVGDIHGQLGCLDAMIDALTEKAPSARWVFVGDYVDRGEQSADVLERLRALEISRPNTVFILGNHEEMMLSFLQDPEGAGNRWMRHGGLQTMASYGAFRLSEHNAPETLRQARDRLLELLPEGVEHWLQTRARLFQSGNVVVVHAGADPTKPMDEQKTQALRWGHSRFGQVPRQDGLWVVHGHTIVDKPKESNGVISIDTGAYATGRLTAVHMVEGNTEFLQARG